MPGANPVWRTCCATGCPHAFGIDQSTHDVVQAAKRCGWRLVDGELYCPVHGRYAEDNQRRWEEAQKNLQAAQRAEMVAEASRRKPARMIFVKSGTPAAEVVRRVTQYPISDGMVVVVTKAEFESLRKDVTVIEADL